MNREEKMKIVINNYFKTECSVNTSIREAFEKGFRIGASKVQKKPEIIYCKDCKWCEDADGLMCKNPASWVVATDCDFGCVLAERRQDE